MLTYFSTLFFPEIQQALQPKEFSWRFYVFTPIIILCFCGYFVSLILLRSNDQEKRARAIFKWSETLLILALVSLYFANLCSRDGVNKTHLAITGLVWFTVLMYRSTFKELLGHPSRVSQTLAAVFMIICVVNLANSFGSLQFSGISREVGGGEPEIAMLKVSPQSEALITEASLPVTNHLVGPIAIILRTDTSLFLLPKSELHSRARFAREIRLESIDAILYHDPTDDQSKLLEPRQ